MLQLKLHLLGQVTEKINSSMMVESLQDLGVTRLDSFQAMANEQNNAQTSIVGDAELETALPDVEFGSGLAHSINPHRIVNEYNVHDEAGFLPAAGKNAQFEHARPEKEYVFVIIANNENNSTQSSTSSNREEDLFKVLDISSSLFDELVDCVSLANFHISVGNLRKVVTKVIENITNKDEGVVDLDNVRSKFFLVPECCVLTVPPGPVLRARKRIDKFSRSSQAELSKINANRETGSARLNSEVSAEEPIVVKPDISEYLDFGIKYPEYVPVGEERLAGAKPQLDGNQMPGQDSSKETVNQDGRYKCDKCDQSYKTELWLTRHQRYRCRGGRVSKARKTKPKRNTRNIHRKQKKRDESDEEITAGDVMDVSGDETGSPSHFCKKCSQSFETKRELNAHIRKVCRPKLSAAARQAVVCEFCGKECPNRSSLYQHLHGHRNLRQHKCPECGKGFSRTQTRNTHVRNVHRNAKEWFYCTKCGIRSLSRKHILAHEQTHNLPEGAPVPTPFECECGKAFISQYKLTIHRNYHHKMRKCEQCETVFNSKPSFLEHKRQCHDVEYKSGHVGKIYKCPACPKELSSVSSLNFHIHNLHSIYNPTKDKSIRCDRCDSAFAMFGTYINHMRETHQEDVTLSDLQAMTETLVATLMDTPGTSVEQGELCEWCQKRFNTKRALYNHKYKVHQAVGETDVACKECDRRFTNKISYYNHYNRAHKKSECFCKECGQPFANRRDYYAHKYSVHTPPQHRTCEICHKEFKDKISLWNHKYAHAPASHVCTECGSKFKRRPDLNRHVRDKHGVGRPPVVPPMQGFGGMGS